MRISLNSVSIMKRIVTYISLALVLMISPLFINPVFSQPIPPTPQTPIGGGLGLFALLGLAFLIRKKLIKK